MVRIASGQTCVLFFRSALIHIESHLCILTLCLCTGRRRFQIPRNDAIHGHCQILYHNILPTASPRTVPMRRPSTFQHWTMIK